MRRRDNKENILRVNPIININSIKALLKERQSRAFRDETKTAAREAK